MGQLRFLRTGEREPVDGVVRREEENAKGVIVAMEEIVVVVVVVEGLRGVKRGSGRGAG